MSCSSRIAILLIWLGCLAGCDNAPKAKPVAFDPSLPAWAQPQITARIVEPADDPAMLCPASARLYARVDNIASLSDADAADPMAQYVWRVVEAMQLPQAWGAASKNLGIDSRAMFSRYFGQTAAVIEQKIDNKREIVVMSRAGEHDIHALIEAMALSPFGSPSQVGPFAMYQFTEGQRGYVIALGKRWFALTAASNVEHLYYLLSGAAQDQPTLADDEAYQQMLAQLPARRVALMFTRNAKNTEHHALAVTADGPNMAVHYTAIIPNMEKFIPGLTQTRGVDFGPLPASTIAAATINIFHSAPPGLTDSKSGPALPDAVREKILPGLTPPLIVYLASLDHQMVTPDPGVTVPVLGIAVKITDPAVAVELDRLVRYAHFLLSLGELDVVQGFFGVRTVEKSGVRFSVADFGRAIARRIEDPQFAKLVNLPSSAGLTQISFGRIGEWYVLCSQEAFFEQCIDALADRTLRLEADPEYARFPFDDHPRLILSALTRAPQLGALLENVADYYRKSQLDPDNLPAREAAAPPSEPHPDRIEEPMRWIAGALQQRQSFSIQLWRDDDPKKTTTLHGLLRITPLDTPTNAQVGQ